MINTIVLYSYQRPEMTNSAIERVLRWNPKATVYVSIDGLRSNAHQSERQWRKSTIAVAEQWASNFPNVIPLVWNINEGLTEHCIRVFSVAFSQTSKLISIEEDNLVSNTGFSFLAESIAEERNIQAATAFTSHFHSPSIFHERFTLFPEQWGTAISLKVFEKFVEVWKNKTVRREVVYEKTKPLFGYNPWIHRLVVEKWHRIFRESVSVPSYGDALFMYCVWDLGCSYRVPINSLVEDLGSMDDRGMNPRQGTFEATPHYFAPKLISNLNFCQRCERESCLIQGTGLKQSITFALRRVSSALSPCNHIN